MKIYLYVEKMTKNDEKRLQSFIKFLNENNIQVTFDERDNFDLVHCLTLSPSNLKFLFNQKLRRIPILMTENKEKDKGKLNIDALKLADCIITYEHFTENKICNLKSIYCEIQTIYSTLENRHFKNKTDDKTIFQNLMNFPLMKEVILVGGIESKNDDLKLLEKLAKEFPHITFVLNKEFKCKKLPKNIIMKNLDNDEILKSAMLFSRCLLIPTKNEIDESLILKALALKIPVLIQDSNVFNNLLKDKINSFIACEFIDYLKSLDYILTKNTSDITNNGYKIALDSTSDVAKKKLLDIYSSLISEKFN